MPITCVGSWVAVRLGGVPAAAAARVAERVAAAAAGGAVPLTAFGLLQHEAKLSVVNFSIRKVIIPQDMHASKWSAKLMQDRL